MDDIVYIAKINQIRCLINELVDELYDYKENKECFKNKKELREQVIEDILYGYEGEK